jgi:tetratricopeptide (TPR) repeat protein
MDSATISFRPQPVGIFPLPAGLLLLPAPQEAVNVSQLLNGDRNFEFPASWHFYHLAIHGELDAARVVLEADTSPLAKYNRFVLSPDAQRFRELRRDFYGEIATLLDLAAFTAGLIDIPPSEASLTRELLALVLMVKAAHCIEKDDPVAAITVLARAVDAARETSPSFAAQLLGQLASLEPASAVRHYRDAIELARGTLLPGLLAELWLNLGMTYQEMAGTERSLLREAAKAYQEALHCGITPERDPDLFALAQNNLGLTYLSMPMTESSDQLRMGIAVQSFREALKVYRRETHPEMWASTHLNLANALQYLPSSHPAENLIQAVEIYDEVAAVRNKAIDPLGYARLLANQANALAHLGMFAPALEKVSEAYKLFHWHGEPDLAASSLELVEQINQKLGAGVA